MYQGNKLHLCNSRVDGLTAASFTTALFHATFPLLKHITHVTDAFIQSNLQLVYSTSMRGHLGPQNLAQGHFGMQMVKTEAWTADHSTPQSQPPTQFSSSCKLLNKDCFYYFLIPYPSRSFHTTFLKVTRTLQIPAQGHYQPFPDLPLADPGVKNKHCYWANSNNIDTASFFKIKKSNLRARWIFRVVLWPLCAIWMTDQPHVTCLKVYSYSYRPFTDTRSE